MADRNLELALRIRAAVQGAESVEDLQRQFDELIDELRRGEEQARETDRSFNGLSAGASKLGDVFQTLAGLAVVQQFVQINRQAESLKTTLIALTGSEQKAAEEIEWLTQTANRLGVAVGDVSDAYIGLMSSSKGTNLEGQKTRDIFEAVTGAMATMGKGGQAVEQALTAISQMMGKGVIQAEELTGQLEEALPGASRALAAALGISVAELRKMSESGALLSSDVLPALASELKKTYGVGAEGANTFSAQLARLQNAVTQVFTQIGESGALQAFKEGTIIAAVGGRTLYGVLELLGTAAGALVAAIATMDFSQFNQTIKDTSDRINRENAAIARYSDTLVKINPELRKTAESTKGFAAAQEGASVSNEKAGGSLAKLQYQYDQLNRKLEMTLALLDRQANAQQAWANVAKDEAELRGDIVQQTQLAITLAEKEATTKQKQATELARAASEAQRYADSLAKQKDMMPSVLEAAQKDAIAKQKEADSAAAAAVAASQQAEATKAANGIILQALGGQTESAEAARAKAQQLRAEYEQMRASGAPMDALIQKMDQVVRAEDAARIAAQGFREEQAITIQQLDQLKGKLDGSIGSQVAYNTALGKYAQQQEQAADQTERRNRLMEDAKGADIAALHAAANLAEARGDEARASELRNAALQRELSLAKEQVTMRQQEKKALEEIVEAKIRESDADGVRTAADQESIQQAKDNVTAKGNEIKSSEAAVVAKQAEAEATQKNTVAEEQHVEVVDNTGESYKRLIEMLNGARERTKELSEAAGAYFEVMLQGTLNAKGLTGAFGASSAAMRALEAAIEGGGGELAKFETEIANAKAAQGQLRQDMLFTVNMLDTYETAIGLAEAATKQAFYEQSAQAERYRLSLEDLVKTGANLSDAPYLLEQATKAVNHEFYLLDEQDLSGLKSAIESANQKLRDMQDEAQAAADRLAELDAQIARERGNTDAADRMDLEREKTKELSDAEKALADARAANNQALVAQIEEQIRKLNELYTLKDNNLEKEIVERTRKAQEPPASNNGGTSTTTTTIQTRPAVDKLEMHIYGTDNDKLNSRGFWENIVRQHVRPVMKDIDRLER